MGRYGDRRSEKKRKQVQAKTQKNKEGRNMSTYGWKNGKWVGWGATAVEKPKTTVDDRTLNILLLKQSSLDTITEICVPKAGCAEFQVHYRATQIIVSKMDKTDPTLLESRVVFTIPTCFFNFPQEVDTGSVHFNLTEVAAISESLVPISDAKSNEIVSLFDIAQFKDKGFNLEVIDTEVGSIHRHPGNFSFSSIDLDNQVNNPGVIFRNLAAIDKIQTDSVIYISGGKTTIVCTETRVVNVAPVDPEEGQSGGISGTYAKAKTMTYILKDGTHSDILQAHTEIVRAFTEFFEPNTNTNATETTQVGYSGIDNDDKFIIKKDGIQEEIDEIANILLTFIEKSNYSPQLFIDAGQITPRTYGAKVNYAGTGSKGRSTYYDAWDYDDEYHFPVGTGTKSNVTPAPALPAKVYGALPQNKTRAPVKPWRIAITINQLKYQGKIDVDKFNILGDSTAEDATRIMEAFIHTGRTYKVAAHYLTVCGYNSVDFNEEVFNHLKNKS